MALTFGLNNGILQTVIMPAGAGGHIKRYANMPKRETLAGGADRSTKGEKEEEELLSVCMDTHV